MDIKHISPFLLKVLFRVQIRFLRNRNSFCNSLDETFAKRPLSKSALIWPISASGSNFIPLFGGTRNIPYIPVVEILAFLDLDQN